MYYLEYYEEGQDRRLPPNVIGPLCSDNPKYPHNSERVRKKAEQWAAELNKMGKAEYNVASKVIYE